MMRFPAQKIKKTIAYLAVITLIAAFILGKYLKYEADIALVEKSFPEFELKRISGEPDVYLVKGNEELTTGKYLVVHTSQGWGGPLVSAALVDSQGQVLDVRVLDHMETPSFFQTVVNARYFEQYPEKTIEDAYYINEDIQAVSGATVTSAGVARAVRFSVHNLGREQFGLTIVERPLDWSFGPDEFILIILYALIILSVAKKYHKLRLGFLAIFVVFLGFRVNLPISLANLAALVMGYVPGFREFLFWWLLIGGVIGLTLIYGKNLYCYWMCPFGGMQELITKIGGVKIRISKKIAQNLTYLVYFFFWFAMMIAFITSNPGLATFEPFGPLFSLKGMGIQWYMISIALIGSFLIPRFWCRFFCPVGLFLKHLAKVGSHLKMYRQKVLKPIMVIFK